MYVCGYIIQLLNILFLTCFIGSSYNIPICIWLMDTHPNNAPMCYVKPTADMHIKVSMFVDHNGKIYLPYLHDWVPVSKFAIIKNVATLQYLYYFLFCFTAQFRFACSNSSYDCYLWGTASSICQGKIGNATEFNAISCST